MGFTISESVSRIRNSLKAVSEDAFVTDRYIYSVVMKYGQTLIKREQRLDRLIDSNSLFTTIPCIELIEVDKIEACCMDIKTNCTIKRSKDKIPSITDLSSGPMIRSLTTLDYSVEALYTQPSIYANMTKTSGFKYNKKKYYWIKDGYIYIPDVEWEAVRLDAVFEEDVSALICGNDPKDCKLSQDNNMNIPEYLFSEAEGMAVKEIMMTAQIPGDGDDDQKNLYR